MVIIQPFTYQLTTAFKERVQLADKLNEVIDLINSWGDVPEQFEQIQEQIENIKQDINTIQTTISSIQSNLSALQTTVTNINAKLNRAAVASTLSASDHIDAEKVGIAINSMDGTTNKVSYLVGATDENAGLMTAADKQRLDDAITEIPIASATTIGGIKVGANLSIAADGTLNATGGGGGEVTLPAHIVGGNDTNALVSVSPVRQNENLIIRTTYKDYTGSASTVKNVDGDPLPIASSEASGLMSATDKSNLDSTKELTDAMSTTLDTVQNDLDTLKQNVEDLKRNMLTDPAQVIQLASAEHDGIIKKEDYSKIGSANIIAKEYGFVYTPISSTITSEAGTFLEQNQDFGLDSDSDKLIITPTNSLIKGSFKTGVLLKDSGMTHYNTPQTSFQAISCLFYTDTLLSSINRINAVFNSGGKNYLLRTESSKFTRNQSNDLIFNGKTYYCYNVTLAGTRSRYGIYAENPSTLNMPTSGTIVNLVTNIHGTHSFACTAKPTVTDIPTGSLIFEPSM